MGCSYYLAWTLSFLVYVSVCVRVQSFSLGFVLSVHIISADVEEFVGGLSEMNFLCLAPPPPKKRKEKRQCSGAIKEEFEPSLI